MNPNAMRNDLRSGAYLDAVDDRSMELLSDAVDHIGRHGHVITAPEVGLSPWYLAALLAPVVLGLGLALMWVQQNSRSGSADELAGDDEPSPEPPQPESFQPKLAASSLVAGLALASLLFPNAVSEVGTAIYQAATTSVAIAAPALYAGSQCAAALPDDDSAIELEDGCDERGALALVSYPLRAALLVSSEARLARPEVAPSPDAVKAGMLVAYQSKQWGLKWAPYTAEAMGNGQRSQLATSLDLGSLLLFGLTVLIGASLWVRAQPILAAWGVDLRDPAQKEQWAEAVALRNYLLYAVLGLGAYLSFAALTALGPFLEARKLAAEVGRESTQGRIDEIASEWAETTLELDLPDDKDLVSLEASLRRYRALRAQNLGQAFLHLRDDHDAIVSRLNEIVRHVDELERIENRPPAPSSTSPDGVGMLLDAVAEPVPPAVLRTAQLLRQRADASIQQLGSFALFESPTPDDPAMWDQRDVRIDQVNGIHDELAAIQADLQTAVTTADPSGPAAAPLERLAQPSLLQPLAEFGDAVRTAEGNYLRSDITAAEEMEEFFSTIMGMRTLRADLRQAEGRLNRRLHEQGRSARDAVRRAQSEFGAVQRSGPAWLDRQEALVGWMGVAYHRSRERLQACGDEVVAAYEATASQAGLAMGALPSSDVEESGTSAPDVSVQLEQFRSTLQAPQPQVPDCVAAADATLAAPKRLGTGARYGTTVGLLAGWLMQSGTVELVLVAGMLGFGLLGAGLSRVVRRQIGAEKRSQRLTEEVGGYVPEPIVEHVPSIVFQGLGATLIVYLAGVGGLGAISTSAPDLDPHVLMLACFTAAVFSEEVWRAARSWVEERARMAPDA